MRILKDGRISMNLELTPITQKCHPILPNIEPELVVCGGAEGVYVAAGGWL
jgi:hypothetical protein